MIPPLSRPQEPTYLTAWRGHNDRTYGGDTHAPDWPAAEGTCAIGMEVIGELVLSCDVENPADLLAEAEALMCSLQEWGLPQ